MMITSTSNQHVQLLAKLQKDRKYREEEGLYCIEGLRLVKEAFNFGKQIVAVYLSEEKSELQKDFSADVFVIKQSVFQSVCQTVHSQGVIAVLKLPSNEVRSCTGNALVLDGLQDPGNVGTILRSATAFGFSSVYLCNCVDVYSPKVIRSAMSAHFALDLFQTDIETAFALLKRDKVVVSADMKGEGVGSFRSNGRSVALVLGNEGNGLSQFSKDNCDRQISIPMQQIESLNVAVAGSILMYVLNNQEE